MRSAASSAAGPRLTAPFTAADPDNAAEADDLQATPTGCQARTRLYRNGTLELEGFPIADISEHMSGPRDGVWLDLRDPDREDLDVLRDEFGLHAVAVEDALHDCTSDRSWTGTVTHLFLTAYGVAPGPATGELATSEIAAFIPPQALITVRKDDGLDIGEVVDRWDASPDLAGHGVGFLLYGLLDYVVDGHFAAVQVLDDAIEELEDDLFADDRTPDKEVQRRSFELRKCLVLLRRVVLPMREVVNTLMRRDLRVVSDDADALLPGHLRPRAARDRVDRVAARPGDHDPRDEPDHPGQPDEHHHQEGHQLGGDHRGADASSPASTA